VYDKLHIARFVRPVEELALNHISQHAQAANNNRTGALALAAAHTNRGYIPLRQGEILASGAAQHTHHPSPRRARTR
jgi:hypothetical protein